MDFKNVFILITELDSFLNQWRNCSQDWTIWILRAVSKAIFMNGTDYFYGIYVNWCELMKEKKLKPKKFTLHNSLSTKRKSTSFKIHLNKRNRIENDQSHSQNRSKTWNVCMISTFILSGITFPGLLQRNTFFSILDYSLSVLFN